MCDGPLINSVHAMKSRKASMDKPNPSKKLLEMVVDSEKRGDLLILDL